jgi:hypothetical protein
MSGKNPFGLKNATFAIVVIVTGALALTPALGSAFAPQPFARTSVGSSDWLNIFTPSGVDSVLAEKFVSAKNSLNGGFPFTPAASELNGSRTITVAARANSRLTAGAVSVRNIIGTADVGAGNGLRLSTVDYRLTASKGWQGFTAPAVPNLATRAPLSDLGKSNFRLDEGVKKPSKFSTSIRLDQNREAAPPARGNAAAGDYKLDVGGSFSISRKVDLTAGVRYGTQNDLLIPIDDNRKDSEAVYVGTKIRF